MTITQGTSGYFWLGAAGSAAAVGEINRWQTTESADSIDVSVFGDRWKDMTNGSVGWTASISGFLDLSDTGQIATELSLTAGTQVESYFFVTGTTYRYGLAYTTNVTTEDTHNGVVTFSADLVGTGQLYKKTS